MRRSLLEPQAARGKERGHETGRQQKTPHHGGRPVLRQFREPGPIRDIDRPRGQQQQEQQGGQERQQTQARLPRRDPDRQWRQQQHAGARVPGLQVPCQHQPGGPQHRHRDPGKTTADWLIQRCTGQKKQVQGRNRGNEKGGGPGVGPRAGGERDQHPDGPGDGCRPAEPDPGRVADDGERCGGYGEQVSKQPGQGRIARLHQGRRDERPDDPQSGCQLPVPQG